MKQSILFSEDYDPIDWSDTESYRLKFGPKAATLAAIPRSWTPPFVIIAPEALLPPGNTQRLPLSTEFLTRLRKLGRITGRLIIRSSVIGETIWDRGKFSSVIMETSRASFSAELQRSVQQVLDSGPAGAVGLVIQSYVTPDARGEFGNLLRVSKTRDQWELTSIERGGTSRISINTQRDPAADSNNPLILRVGARRQRLFGSIAAWINNYLLLGRLERVNCEWVSDERKVYIVQLDKEDEDFRGINPFQVRVEPIFQTIIGDGPYLRRARGRSNKEWDKLEVLSQLFDRNDQHKPMLFYLPMSILPRTDDTRSIEMIAADFDKLIGPNNIIVRTSVRSGKEKIANMPRTEGLTPRSAADWCLSIRDNFGMEGKCVADFAFVAHRFISARASAWARADPGSPQVEIHSLWGLPDALQYLPYDIWEVHLPTLMATEYSHFKSHMLVSTGVGKWEYARIKNEMSRTLSISRREALEIAQRTGSIAKKLRRACHVMWFVGCVEPSGHQFNIPWYWTEAHSTQPNVDRTNYKVTTISSRVDLENYRNVKGSSHKQAIQLMPTDQSLMRDKPFIADVGATARERRVPVVLAGSTLAHAYYELVRQGCTVVTPSEKEYSRVRRNLFFGKIVRDKIPLRIAEKQESEVTRRIPETLKRNFLISKLLEEALEVRNSDNSQETLLELADIYELIRALAHLEGHSIDEVGVAASAKRAKVGGFEEGVLLLQTGVLGKGKGEKLEISKTTPQFLARKLSGSIYELPFTFFGFMELDKVRSLYFDDFGIILYVTLKGDRIELRAAREPEQLELALDAPADSSDDAEV